jgi:hypothetical protein
MATKKKKSDDGASEKPVTESGMSMTRELLVRLSDGEVAMKARRREEVAEKREGIEREKKEAVDEFNERLSECDEEIEKLRDMVRTGLDRRPVTCLGQRDPENGRICFVRPDTGEVIDWRPMTSTEKQLSVGDRPAMPGATRVVNAVCDACGVVTPSGSAPVHHGDCPKVKPIEEAVPPALPFEMKTETTLGFAPKLGDAIDLKMPEAPPEEPVDEHDDRPFHDDDRDGDDEDEGSLPPPPEEPSKLSPAIGVEVVDCTGAAHVVTEAVANALRAANRAGRPIYGAGNVELSHVKGEPVRVEVEGGRTFDLLPSELSGLRKAFNVQREKEIQIIRSGKPWRFLRIATWRFLRIATPLEDRDDGAAAIEAMGADELGPPPGDEPAPKTKAKRGSKKGAK